MTSSTLYGAFSYCHLHGLVMMNEQLQRALFFLFVFVLFFLVISNLNMYNFCNVKRNFIGKSRRKPEMKHGHSWYTGSRGQFEELRLWILLNNYKDGPRSYV